jgi:hydrocephalus-inducing protein
MLRDTVNIVVNYGKHLTVQLVAKGVGTSMFCSDDLRVIDLGNVFTMRAAERTFIFENRGKRKQSLLWSNPTHKLRVSERSRALLEIERLKREKSAEAKKKLKGIVVPEEAPAVFTVFPPAVDLKPMTGCKFTLKCESAAAGSFMEQLVLESKVSVFLLFFVTGCVFIPTLRSLFYCFDRGVEMSV